MTGDQDRAFQALNDYYGDCEVKPLKDGIVKLIGKDDEGIARARWMVDVDGGVTEAWDPDYLLNSYEGRRAS